MDSDHVQPEGVAVGEALRRLRAQHGQSQEACADYLRRFGLPWNRDTVVTLENGRRETITLRDLIGLSMAYDVPLSHWFDGPGDIRISDTVTVTRDDLRRALRGDRLPRRADVDTLDDLRGRRATGRPAGLPHLPARGFGLGPRPLTEPEARSLPLAKALNMSPEQAHGVAVFAWGHSLEEERDHRIGDTSAITPQSLRARRGNMTRLLVNEVIEKVFMLPPDDPTFQDMQAAVRRTLDRSEAQARAALLGGGAGEVTGEPGPPAR